MRSYETKERAVQEYLETPPKYSILVHIEARSRERLAILPNASHAVVFHNTLPAASIEKAVCVKTQDELYQKVRLTAEPSSDSKSYGETWNNTVDYRISGVPLSTVEQQDTTRENKVKKLIEKFENHKHKESFLQDLSQTQKLNEFSRGFQVLIADLNNTEIFELCENFTNQQCTDCNAYWEICIICCSCGRNMKSS